MVEQVGIKPYFIRSNVDSINYGGKVLSNMPVNISLCSGIRKGKFAWYPDDTGRPTIKFEGCNVEWRYDSEAERDQEFFRIATNQF